MSITGAANGDAEVSGLPPPGGHPSAGAPPTVERVPPLRTVRATAYLTPLREGGSLPALMEADDDGIYVTKFRGAGQGTASLVAEVIVAGVAARLGVRVPELVVVDLDEAIAPREADEEVQDLLRASTGTNLGMDYLPGSTGYDGRGSWTPDVDDAVRVLWLDAFTGNVDRTWRNPNLLVWHRRLWAIDHGSALVFQHAWPDPATWAGRIYDLGGHVLLPVAERFGASAWAALDAELAARLDPATVREVVEAVPGEWLLAMNSARSRERAARDAGDPVPSAADWRERYVSQLLARLTGERPWRDGLLP